MMKREITCIVCPRGCRMTADIQGETITVTGHTCPRGEKHAIDEILHPVRSLTSIVRVSNRRDTMVSGRLLTLTMEVKLRTGCRISSMACFSPRGQV